MLLKFKIIHHFYKKKFRHLKIIYVQVNANLCLPFLGLSDFPRQYAGIGHVQTLWIYCPRHYRLTSIYPGLENQWAILSILTQFTIIQILKQNNIFSSVNYDMVYNTNIGTKQCLLVLINNFLQNFFLFVVFECLNLASCVNFSSFLTIFHAVTV